MQNDDDCAGVPQELAEKLRDSGSFKGGGEKIWPHFPRLNGKGKWNFLCAYCEMDLLKDIPTWQSSHDDHILPQSKYKSLVNEPTNHAPSCCFCNNLKGRFDAAKDEPRFRDSKFLTSEERTRFIDAAKEHIEKKRKEKEK